MIDDMHDRWYASGVLKATTEYVIKQKCEINKETKSQ